MCASDEKLGQLLHILNEFQGKTMVYFATCACVDYYYKAIPCLLPALKKQRSILSLHGKMDPKRREGNFYAFIDVCSCLCFLCID